MENGIVVLRQINWTEYGQTVLHPLAVTVLVVMGFLILFNDSKYIMIPFLIIGCFITNMQRVVLATMDFNFIRLLLTVAFFRLIIRNEYRDLNRVKMDNIIIVYIIVLSLAYIALYKTGSAVANRMGNAFEVLLSYFTIRYYLKTIDQLLLYIRFLVFVFFLIAIFMAVEQLTQYNMLSVFGGIPEFTMVREGRVRAQGAFSHPILAGSFGARYIPIFWGLAVSGTLRDKKTAAIGILSGLVIVWASSSSGPVLSALGALGAIFFWKLRSYSKYIMPVLIAIFVFLQIVMEAPAWHLISRIDVVGGSTGYHRYALIDATIRNFSEWALFGVKTTGHWGWGLNDVTNMFIAEGVSGGFLTLILFIWIIANAFKSIGTAMKNNADSLFAQKFIWAWACLLFADIISFFGVSYFGQMRYFWIQTLAIIACLPNLDFKKSHIAQAEMRYKNLVRFNRYVKTNN